MTTADTAQRAKTTKKVVLRLECTQCKTKAQVWATTAIHAYNC